MYHSYYLRLKPIGFKNSKSYQIVVTYKTFNKNVPFKYIEKVGLILNLKYNSRRSQRIILLNTLRLKYWFIKKIIITKSLIYHLFFCNYEYDQGCKSFLTLYNTNYINNKFIKFYSFNYCLKNSLIFKK